MAALAVVIAACSQSRAPETPVEAKADCARCHGYPPPASGPFLMPTTTAHPTSTNCNACHPGTVEADNVTIVPGGLHMNGTVEAAGHADGYAAPAQHGPDALVALGGAGSCTACHGTDFAGGSSGVSCTGCHQDPDRAPAPVADWKTNCTFCHGTITEGVTAASALAAPPQSVLGETSGARVGAHQAHLTQGEFANALPCESCHATVPTNALDHFDGYALTSSVTPAFGTVASKGVTGGAVYAGDGGTCATYCHGSGSQFTNPNPASPAWTAAPGAVTCGDCHGTPPASGPSIGAASPKNAHQFHLDAGATCGTCHEGYTSSDVNFATHVNGTKDVVVQKTGGGTQAIQGWDCNGCHAATSVAIHALPLSLADHKALALKDIASCTACHGSTYDGAVGDSCNGCHTTAQALAPGFADWKTNCTFCHGTRTQDVATATAAAAPPQAVTGGDITAANPKVGAHQKHVVAGTFAQAIACEACHTGAVPTGAEALTHFDGYDGTQTATVAFSAFASTGVTGPGYTAGSCAVYCHGSGSQFSNPTNQASPAWTSTGMQCGSCHAVPPVSGPTIQTADAHSFHLAKLAVEGKSCEKCHDGYSTTQVVLAKHVNGTKDVVVQKSAGGTQVVVGWDCTGCHVAAGVGHPVPYTTHKTDALANIASCQPCHGADYGGIAGFTDAPTAACNTCHANAASASAPGWKQNCTFCHGTPTQNVTDAQAAAAPPQAVLGGDIGFTNPRVGAHQAHLTQGDFANALPCESCHTVPTDAEALTHFAGYDGSQADVAFSTLAKQGVTTPAYGAGGGTCAVYCHGSGNAFPSNPAGTESPAWTSAGILCGECHGTPPASGPAFLAPDAHAYHLAKGATCASCHGTGYSYDSGAQTGTVKLATHVDGTKQVAANGTPINGWDCKTCHDVIGIPPASHPVPYPAHTTDALAGLGGCTGCHGSDYGGRVDIGAPSCTGCHTTDAALAPGFPDWQTNCTFCHGTRTAGFTGTPRNLPAPPQTVTGTDIQTTANPRVGAHQRHTAPAGNALLTLSTGFACTECHPSVTDLTHVDGGTHAPLQSGPIASANGATSTLSSTTCNTYCHGSSMPGTGRTAPTWAPPSPTGAALGCGSCHQAIPTTGQHPAVQSSHDTLSCAACHGTGYTATAVTGAARTTHVNGSKTVSTSSSVGWQATPVKGCAASCHDGNFYEW